jgi:hypothetical protein
MLRAFMLLLTGFMLAASSAIAQTTTEPAAPATPATPAPAADAGGIADWWWVIILIILIAAAIWYFMKPRKPAGRV